MNITNRYGLPESIIEAVRRDMTPRDGFSVTDIIAAPREVQLSRRHWDELEEDAIERIWALLGSAVHYVLANAGVDCGVREERIYAEVDGMKLSGKPDIWKDATITDIKITSAWTLVFDRHGRPEWHAQLNCYRWLCQQVGLDTKVLQICAILRDWDQRKLADNPDYPRQNCVTIDVPVWVYIDLYVRERLKLHYDAVNLPDDQLPPCTPEEMWEKPTKYAVMKKGRKIAIKLFPTSAAAHAMIENSTEPLYIEKRPGFRRKCSQYCAVSQFCGQYREYRDGQRK